jgi:hypothetical protein
MPQHDLSFPYFSPTSPMWEPAQMPAFLKGLQSRSQVKSSASGSLAQFGRSMDAFAEIVVPPDPEVPGDRGAGGEGFSQQVIRLIQNGTVPELGAEITEDDARAVFAELDAHASAGFGRHSFAQLPRDPQERLVDHLLAGTLAPITVSGPGASAVLQSLGRLMLVVVKTAYWTNFPEHRVRSGPLGFGSGNVIFSDPRNQISNPNVPGSGTAWDYLGWHYPIRKGVEDKVTLAFLEADVPHRAADSEAALADLLARDAARTLINHD